MHQEEQRSSSPAANERERQDISRKASNFMTALAESEQVMAFMGSDGDRIKMRKRSNSYRKASNTSSDGPMRARSNSVENMQIGNLIS